MLIDLKQIKKIYINLENQPEKRNYTEKLFNSIGFNNFERFNAIVDRSYMSSGCSLSHKTVLKKFMNEYPLLILEDDNNISNWYNQYIPQNGIIDIPDDCDMFYLGYSIAEGVHKPKRPFSCSFVTNKIIKINSTLSAHSIIFITEKSKISAVNAIEECTRQKIPGDIGYCDMLKNLNVYSFNRVIFYQKDNNSKYTNVEVLNDNRKYYNVYSENNKIIATKEIE